MANDTTANASVAINDATAFATSIFKASFKSVSTWSVKRKVKTESVDESTGEVSTTEKEVVIPMIRVYLGRNFAAVDKSGKLISCNYFDVTRAGFIRQLCQANIDIQSLVNRAKTTNDRNKLAAKAAFDNQDEDFVPAEDVSYYDAIITALPGSTLEIEREAIAKDTNYVDFNGNAQKASRDQFFTSIVSLEPAPSVAAVFESLRLKDIESLMQH